MEGLQCCEKIYLLRKELSDKKAMTKLKKLDDALTKFTPEGLVKYQESAAESVHEMNELLNSL